MDPIPKDYSQRDYAGLKLIDFYILPHYLTAPFKKATEQIMQAFPTLEICAINNSQAVIIEDGKQTVISVEWDLFVLASAKILAAEIEKGVLR